MASQKCKECIDVTPRFQYPTGDALGELLTNTKSEQKKKELIETYRKYIANYGNDKNSEISNLDLELTSLALQFHRILRCSLPQGSQGITQGITQGWDSSQSDLRVSSGAFLFSWVTIATRSAEDCAHVSEPWRVVNVCHRGHRGQILCR